MRGDVPYFIWHGSRTSYKHTNICGVRVYIINGRVTRKNIDDISHHGYLMGYSPTTVVILYWNIDQTFLIHRYHHDWFDE